MNHQISPKYLMKLVKSVNDEIWRVYKSYNEVSYYIYKWYEGDENWGNYENFNIHQREDGKIDLLATLHNIPGDILLKIAIDLGVYTPDFIPSIPIFRNELKSNYETAFNTFEKAYKQSIIDPSLSIGLANSALESIIKEILKDNRITIELKGTETLYKLSSLVLKHFNIVNKEHPIELRTIGSSLLAICQAIEKIRSEKTNFHGKTKQDYLVSDSIYSTLILNSISTVGMYILSYYKSHYPVEIEETPREDELPF